MYKKFSNALFILFSIMVSLTELMGQSASFSNVFKAKLRDSGAIMDGQKVNGYYFFYRMDKADKTHDNYVLEILDQDLNTVKTNNIREVKNIVLLEASYNGQFLCFKFLDAKNKKYIFSKYDNAGNYVSKHSIAYNKATMDILSIQQTKNEQLQPAALFPVKNVGFVNFGTDKFTKDDGYYIKMINNNPEGKNWMITSNKESKDVESAVFLYANEDILLINHFWRKSKMSKDMRFAVKAFDIKTGKKRYELKIDDGKYQGEPMNAMKDELTGNIILTGVYYNSGEKTAKQSGEGVFSWAIDSLGKLVESKYLSYDLDIAKKLPATVTEKKFGFFRFHNFVRTTDNKIYGIAEEYAKVVDGASVALNALVLASGGTSDVSVFKMVVRDLYIAEFDPSMDLQELHHFPKGKNSIALPGGAALASPGLLEIFIDMAEGWDYSFTQSLDGDDNFMVGYTDYVKGEGEKKRNLKFNAIALVDGKFNKDVVTFDSESTSSRWLPAKPGYVLMLEYFKKKKEIKLHLEKLNY